MENNILKLPLTSVQRNYKSRVLCEFRMVNFAILFSLGQLKNHYKICHPKIQQCMFLVTLPKQILKAFGSNLRVKFLRYKGVFTTVCNFNYSLQFLRLHLKLCDDDFLIIYFFLHRVKLLDNSTMASLLLVFQITIFSQQISMPPMKSSDMKNF